MGFLLLALFGAIQETYAQKNKNNEVSKLTDEAKYQSEFYFIEGEKFFLIEDFPKALEMFSRTLDINPSNAAAHYKIAEIYMKSGELIKALPHAMQTLEINPENKYYYILNATLQTQLGNYPKAAEHFEAMFARFEGNNDYLYDLAQIYQYSEEYEKALLTYEKVETEYGKQVEVTRMKQKILMKQNKFDLVRDEWEKLLEEQYDEEILLEYADILITNGDFLEASKVIEEAINLYPSNPVPYLSLAELKKSQGEVLESITYLKYPFEDGSIEYEQKLQVLAGYIENLPNDSLQVEMERLIQVLQEEYPMRYQSYAIAGDLYYKVGDPNKAVENYLLSVKKDETNFNVWQNIISILNESGNYDGVIETVGSALEVFPNQAILYFYEGSAHLLKKDNQKAVAVLEQGVKYARQNPGLYAVFLGQLGDAYNASGDHKSSDEAFEKALKEDPNNDYVLNNYSYYLSLRNENLEKAMAMSEKLVERNPENSTYLDTHAWVLYKLGKYKDARKYLERAVGKSGANGVVFEHYGDVLFKLGQKNEAVIQWEKAKLIGEVSDLIDKKIAERKLYE